MKWGKGIALILLLFLFGCEIQDCEIIQKVENCPPVICDIQQCQPTLEDCVDYVKTVKMIKNNTVGDKEAEA